MQELTAALFQPLIADWQRRLSPSTQHKYGQQLKQAVHQLATHYGPARNILYGLQLAKNPGPRTRIATQQEIETALAAARGGLRMLLLLVMDTGIRHAEARRISERDVDFKRQLITFRQKGGTFRTMPVTQRIIDAMKQAPPGLPEEPYVDRYQGGPRWRCHYQDRWAVLRKKCGLPRDLRIHDLRRTLATRAYDKTKDLRLVQELLGHKSMSSTIGYLAPRDPNNLRPLIDELQADTKWTH